MSFIDDLLHASAEVAEVLKDKTGDDIRILNTEQQKEVRDTLDPRDGINSMLPEVTWGELLTHMGDEVKLVNKTCESLKELGLADNRDARDRFETSIEYYRIVAAELGNQLGTDSTVGMDRLCVFYEATTECMRFFCSRSPVEVLVHACMGNGLWSKAKTEGGRIFSDDVSVMVDLLRARAIMLEAQQMEKGEVSEDMMETIRGMHDQIVYARSFHVVYENNGEIPEGYHQYVETILSERKRVVSRILSGESFDVELIESGRVKITT